MRFLEASKNGSFFSGLKKVANLVHRKSILYARMPIFVCKVGRIETNLVHYYTKGGGQ
jgi:hypothetical protein